MDKPKLASPVHIFQHDPPLRMIPQGDGLVEYDAERHGGDWNPEYEEVAYQQPDGSTGVKVSGYTDLISLEDLRKKSHTEGHV